MPNLQLLSVQDQGFEAGIGDWVALTNCSIAQSAVQAQAGTKSLALTSTAGGSMQATTGNLPVMPGRSYSFGGWARADAAAAARVAQVFVLWYQSDGTTASALHASDSTSAGTNDSTSAWTQLGTVPNGTVVTAPLDAFYAKFQVKITATGAGAEVHYFDTLYFFDVLAPFFKAGRLSEVLLNQFDLSGYLAQGDLTANVDMLDVTTFKNTYKVYISGTAGGQQAFKGFYDPTSGGAQQAVRQTLQVAPGVLSFAPGGATAIGDPVRLLSFNDSHYAENSKVSGAVGFDWSVAATSPLGAGECLAPISAGSQTGTITGTGSPLLAGVSSSTGAIAHLHVTATDGGSVTFKLQDATALNSAYVDITGGAFTAVTAVGAQRLIIPGTIRAYVRAVATLGGQHLTYAIHAART